MYCIVAPKATDPLDSAQMAAVKDEKEKKKKFTNRREFMDFSFTIQLGRPTIHRLPRWADDNKTANLHYSPVCGSI